MGKKSRENHKREEKLEKARAFNQKTNTASIENGGIVLNPNLAKLPTGGDIPDLAGENPNVLEPAEKSIAINIAPRGLDHQEIERIEKEDAKALVHKFFCVNTTCKSNAQQQGLIRDKVENGGLYAFLYKNVPPDIEILEIKFRDEGRVFGYFVEDVFNVVAVRTKHLQ